MIAAVSLCASAGSSLAAVDGGSVIGPVAGSGDPAGTIRITPAPSCSDPSACTSFDFAFTNTGSLTINGMTIQIAPPNAITAFAIVGQPAFKSTGVQGAYGGYPLNIAPGATERGSGTTSSALHAGDMFKIFTTPDGFATVHGADIPFAPEVLSIRHAIVTGAVGEYAGAGQTITTAITLNYRFLAAASVRLEADVEADPAAPKRPARLARERFYGEVTGAGRVEVSIDPPATATSHTSLCRWMINRQAQFRTQSCSKPVWLQATVSGGKWTFAIQRPLPVGHYVIEARAPGETTFSAARHNRVTLDVRP